MPVWNGSSDQLVFTKYEDDDLGLMVKRPGSDTELRVMPPINTFILPHDWHPDGRLLFGIQTAPSNRYDFWLVRTDGTGRAELWLKSDDSHNAATSSPDGKWVAYESAGTGPAQIYVRRFPDKEVQAQISRDGGRLPRWRPDGKGLFYLQDKVLMEADLGSSATLKPSVPRELFPVGETVGYAVLRDGKNFLLCRPIDPPSPPSITVVVNWAVGLTKKQVLSIRRFQLTFFQTVQLLVVL